jgi:hypothetical protein
MLENYQILLKMKMSIPLVKLVQNPVIEVYE